MKEAISNFEGGIRYFFLELKKNKVDADNLI